MSEQLAAALAMAKRGFRVFPLRPYGKKPAIGAFQFVASSDEATIRAWWQADPRYNVGVLTTGIVVADLDNKKGRAGSDEYIKNGGHFNTFTVYTPSGGYHCYFDGPDSKLAVHVFPGVDIRSHNGYVVGPGSYVDATLSGEHDVTVSGAYSVVADLPLCWVPPSIECKLEAPGRRERIDLGVELDTPTAIANATVWLQSAEPAIEGQGGDNKTYETAAKLVRDWGLSEETAFELLTETWNERCIPPWPADLLWLKVQNAAAYGQGDLGAARPEAFFNAVSVIPTPLSRPAHERGVYMGNLYDAMDVRPRPWVVSRLLLKGDVTVLAGGGAGGKSAWTLAALAHFAVGKDFGPYKLANPGVPLRSMIYNAEDDREEQSRRVLAICHQFNLDYPTVKANLASMDDAQGELLLAVAALGAPQPNEAAIKYLTEACVHDKVDILDLDPLVNLHTCNENDNGAMRFVMSIIRRIARDAGVSVLVSHHTSKGSNSSGKGDADAIRGAGAIINSARVAVMISGITDGDRKEFGIAEEDKYSYIRLDDAKANMFQRTGHAIDYLKWQSIRLTTGDMVGVPAPVNMRDKSAAHTRYIAGCLCAALVAQGTGAFNLAEAVRVLQNDSELYEKMPVQTLRHHIQKALKNVVQVEGANAGIVCEHDGPNVLIKLV